MSKAFFAIFLASRMLLAGGDSAHGGDGFRGVATAWFLGSEKTVGYCVEIDSNRFGASLDQANSSLEQALRLWSQYLESRLDLPKGPFAITTKFSLTQCDGSEDLKFYLGAENDDVKIARAEFSAPVAFAKVSTLNPMATWRRGFIWISNPKAMNLLTHLGFRRVALDWTSKDNLLGILLHELGHVIGVGHIPGTIMDESITHRLVAKQISALCPEGDAKLASIDHFRELIPRVAFHQRGLEIEWKGVLTIRGAKALFPNELSVAQPAVLRSVPSNLGGLLERKIYLSVAGRHILIRAKAGRYGWTLPVSGTPHPVFQRAFVDNGKFHLESENHSTLEWDGMLEKMPVRVSYNTDPKGVVVLKTEGDSPMVEPLFVSAGHSDECRVSWETRSPARLPGLPVPFP